MDRRNFLNMMVGGVAASAAVRTWPFRVFSFPSEITLSSEIQRWRATHTIPLADLVVDAWEPQGVLTNGSYLSRPALDEFYKQTIYPAFQRISESTLHADWYQNNKKMSV